MTCGLHSVIGSAVCARADAASATASTSSRGAAAGAGGAIYLETQQVTGTGAAGLRGEGGKEGVKN